MKIATTTMLYGKVIIVYPILYYGFKYFGSVVKEGRRGGNCNLIVEDSEEESIFTIIDFLYMLIVYG